MKFLPIFLIGICLSPALRAMQIADAVCAAPNCLVGGWTSHDWEHQITTVVQCLSQDCARYGWSEGQIGGGLDQINKCNGYDCLKTGWSTTEFGTGREISETYCLANASGDRDCMTGGWVVQSDFTQVTVTCVVNDCRRNGWQINVSPDIWLRAVCRPGGCFERGWNLYRN